MGGLVHVKVSSHEPTDHRILSTPERDTTDDSESANDASFTGGRAQRVFAFEKKRGVPQFELNRRKNERLKQKQQRANDLAIFSIRRVKEIEKRQTDATRVCFNYTAPLNGAKGSNWRDVLPYGETNTVTCNLGYEPTLSGVNTCDNDGRSMAPCVNPNYQMRNDLDVLYPLEFAADGTILPLRPLPSFTLDLP